MVVSGCHSECVCVWYETGTDISLILYSQYCCRIIVNHLPKTADLFVQRSKYLLAFWLSMFFFSNYITGIRELSVPQRTLWNIGQDVDIFMNEKYSCSSFFFITVDVIVLIQQWQSRRDISLSQCPFSSSLIVFLHL